MAAVAFAVEATEACAVRNPLVLPEVLVIAVSRLPDLVHLIDGAFGSGVIQNLCDVCVCAVGIAVGWDGTIVMDGPEAMNGP